MTTTNDAAKSVIIDDTTLRDGERMDGVFFNFMEKAGLAGLALLRL